LIKTSGGKYVAPQMIEGMINQSEFVEQAVVVGDKRKFVSGIDRSRLRTTTRVAKEQGIPAGNSANWLPTVARLI